MFEIDHIDHFNFFHFFRYATMHIQTSTYKIRNCCSVIFWSKYLNHHNNHHLTLRKKIFKNLNFSFKIWKLFWYMKNDLKNRWNYLCRISWMRKTYIAVVGWVAGLNNFWFKANHFNNLKKSQTSLADAKFALIFVENT